MNSNCVYNAEHAPLHDSRNIVWSFPDGVGEQTEQRVLCFHPQVFECSMQLSARSSTNCLRG